MLKGEEKIYLDQKGYDQYMQEIQDLKDKLKNNSRIKSDAYESAVGDGWHDNFAFEDAKREEFKIMGMLREKIEGLSRIVVIDKALNENLIDINDYVTVNVEYSKDDKEEFLFKLVGLSHPNINSEVSEISINSPLGKSVYQKSIGYEGSYDVNGNTISFVIVNVTKDYNNIQDNSDTIKRSK